MKESITKYIFSFTALSVLFGVIGLLSSFVTLFIDVNSSISIKWLLFTLVIFFSLTTILFKLIFDLSEEKRKLISDLSREKQKSAFEHPISYHEPLNNEPIFLIRQNQNFIYNIYVAGYLKRDQLDTLVFVGYVKNPQEKFIQIAVVKWFEKIDLKDANGNSKDEIVKSIEIRPVIPINVFNSLSNLNTLNDYGDHENE
ncbi:MAG: hypothetical protein Q4D78_07075 [Neisseria zoodegmatis]|uniref:hypothetical protein n=1 Tax=Neisseria zoodegmatis TaxID=326523 RepID=UPI0026EEF129|nr:hypothetical protein [Neisseria zoodegmatis]MDO5069945.1 hypothetical protein [Neisseria zoodegmatis]